jgi:hypothetical protein
LQSLCKKQPGNTKTQFWKAKGPDAMDVNAIKEEEESQLLKANTKMNRKKLTNEERAALRLLGLCYFY